MTWQNGGLFINHQAWELDEKEVSWKEQWDIIQNRKKRETNQIILSIMQ